ncbi:hypothetical protein JCGZ_02545 [Jatropha curcas]|uniref:Bet v I/Major latex protein domain-containing protein n=2 Tax=Jatropha curcas TaxID=180498 RepID=A0A067L4U1_JATCU|nr:hypothetical protein JCGZ_02545 [Jatropha curcas]
MKGQLSHELEVSVSASEAWKLYSTLKLAKLVEKELTIIDKIELVEGDGGVGTVIELVFIPGAPGFPGYKKKFIKIDNEKRIKVTDVVEG